MQDLFDDDLFAEEPEPKPARQRPPRRPPRHTGETLKRVLVALPWVALTIAIVVAGGLVFTLALVAIGALCLREYLAMTAAARPIGPAAYIAVAALIVAAHFGTAFNVLLVFAAGFAVLFVLAARVHRLDGVTVSIGVTLLGIVWIGIPLVHAVLLRDLPNHGAALLVDVLVGTFAGDTGAYAVGRTFGSHRIAPSLSPNKTLEGLVGGFLIGTMAFWFAGLYQDWLSGADALLIGAAVAAIAPVGDLFESMLKRDTGTKDTGTLFGPHGGILDRLDAVFFTVVVGYYLAVHLLYSPPTDLKPTNRVGFRPVGGVCLCSGGEEVGDSRVDGLDRHAGARDRRRLGRARSRRPGRRLELGAGARSGC
ncbi:MAG: phosphatidate cytidylyltransferase [Chloroflexota bacterium]